MLDNRSVPHSLLFLEIVIKASTEVASANPARLGAMPNELKLLILRQAPDVPTLRSLARTSRSFWALYVQYRQTLVPAATIAQLVNQNNFDTSLVGDCYMTIRFDPAYGTITDMERSLDKLRKQMRQLDGPVKLSAKECLRLLTAFNLDVGDGIPGEVDKSNWRDWVRDWDRYW